MTVLRIQTKRNRSLVHDLLFREVQWRCPTIQFRKGLRLPTKIIIIGDCRPRRRSCVSTSWGALALRLILTITKISNRTRRMSLCTTLSHNTLRRKPSFTRFHLLPQARTKRSHTTKHIFLNTLIHSL